MYKVKKGILHRQIRSIQTEGHFGDIKENDNFRRFNHRTSEKVHKEFFLYAIGRMVLCQDLVQIKMRKKSSN